MQAGLAASDDECSVGKIARRGAVASIRFRRRGRPLKGVGAGARIGLQKQKYGRRRQAEPRIAAYHPKPKDALRAKRPSRDIAASRAA